MTSQPKDLLALRDLIRRYQVNFRLEYAGVQICEGIVRVTFYLSLKGQHNEQGKGGPGCCSNDNRVLQVLLDVADTLPPSEQAFKRAGYDWEKRLHYNSGRRRGREVALGLHMTIRRSFAEATDGWGWKFLRLVTVALTELGCRDRATREFSGGPPSVQPTTKERSESAWTRVSIDAVDTRNSERLLTV